MFSESVPKNFEITKKASVVESLLSKVAGEISAVYNSVENLNTCVDTFQKVALLDISRNPLLTGVLRLQSYSQSYSLNS